MLDDAHHGACAVINQSFWAKHGHIIPTAIWGIIIYILSYFQPLFASFSHPQSFFCYSFIHCNLLIIWSPLMANYHCLPPTMTNTFLMLSSHYLIYGKLAGVFHQPRNWPQSWADLIG